MRGEEREMTEAGSSLCTVPAALDRKETGRDTGYKPPALMRAIARPPGVGLLRVGTPPLPGREGCAATSRISTPTHSGAPGMDSRHSGATPTPLHGNTSCAQGRKI